MTYRQQETRLKRGKRHDATLYTLDKADYAQRLMDRLANGEKMKPEGKSPKPSRRKPGVPPDPYANYEEGVCSGCHEKLLRSPKGRVFHRAGVSTNCQYGSPDYTVEIDAWNHTYRVTIGGVSRTYSMFEYSPISSNDGIEMNVPDWCFFSMDLI